MNKKIEIESFNPYESRFPDRKLVNSETLILIKHLRSEGYEVCILPDNEKPIQYLFKKGIQELLSDPIFTLAVNIPISVLTGLMTNYIQKLINMKKSSNSRPSIKIENLIVNHHDTKNYYLSNGEHIDKAAVKVKKSRLETQKNEFCQCFTLKSPYLEYPVPIFLEHQPKVIGWCDLCEDEYGLRAEGIIIDKVTRRRRDQGRLNGASVTGIAELSKCSICEQNYVDCNHISGIMYDGIKCINHIIERKFVEASLVKRPVNERCLIGLK